ncbi:prevent-host-death protein [Arsukibacterium tuosuense]|uniref:prevent-host-death protein n=1 Tax=Arsukibacterium tuosuense TaxID=1323745 RepID=UPI001141B510|nr:prevent-host-death protein [Arsukibacterium tuosuense]
MKISKDNKVAIIVRAKKDCEKLEAIKAEYLKHCFKVAKADLAQGKVVDGETFLKAL